MRLAHLAALAVSIVLGAGAWLWYSHTNAGADPESAVQALTRDTSAATRLGALARAQAAASSMESLAAARGSYAGATAALLRGLDPTLDPSVTVVLATDDRYCVQAGLGDAIAHVAGPGGVAEAGPCQL